MKNLIEYFLNRPVIANVLMFGLIFIAIGLWPKMGKEEMPEFASNWFRATIRYPGASAADVELFIVKPVEEKLKGVTGLLEVGNTSSYGNASFSIEFEPNTSNLQEKIQEVKDAIDSVPLPKEAEEAVYRQFKSSEKAIIDVGVYLTDTEILDTQGRAKLQEYALAFKNKLLTEPEISGVDLSGYLRPELQIQIDPEKLKNYEISMNQVKEQILQQNIRQPIGSMRDKGESEVTIVSELDNVESLKEVIVTSGFQGQKIKLADVANIKQGFERAKSVLKIQGREGIRLSIQKGATTDILSGQKAVVDFLSEFTKNNPDSGVEFVLIDDESYDVRNRLSLIGANGILGFVLIAFVLFLFLDFKSGLWVAMGIPFCLAFTMIAAMMMGYTVNNMTLASIIIVLGIVVDDAIIVAENIQRKLSSGMSTVAQATTEMMSPILASVLTTCAAFIPLYFFTGRFGLFVKYIPLIVFLMLIASLFESAFILPAHMKSDLPLASKFARKVNKGRREKIVAATERGYENLLVKVLPYRGFVLIGFALLLGASAYLFQHKMKYVMFPREESRDFSVIVKAQEGVPRYEMATKVRAVEDIFLNDDKGVVTSVRTTIGQSRRGGEVRENEASLTVEILPPSERSISLNQLLKEWESKAKSLDGFVEIRFLRSRFGSSSGSAIEIKVLANNDEQRSKIASDLKNELEEIKGLTNVEIERPLRKNEFKLEIKRDLVSRLGISYAQLSNVLRSYIEGDVLYTLNKDEEEVDVRFSSSDMNKNDINKLLALTVANRENYLVPIGRLVDVVERQKPSNINRINYKRGVTVLADLDPQSGQTPLEIAEYLEQDVFGKLLAGKPSAELKFIGEVADSRESQSDFGLSVALVLGLIYVLLVFLFDSVFTPLLIGAIIPFGAVGVVLAFALHGLEQYGFFAVIGALGMVGVVINDSIVLVNKLETLPVDLKGREEADKGIAGFTASRLRAVVVTTLTTVAGLFPTAYGLGGYDSMLAEMMLAMGWGLLFGMFITLALAPCLYSYYYDLKSMRARLKA